MIEYVYLTEVYGGCQKLNAASQSDAPAEPNASPKTYLIIPVWPVAEGVDVVDVPEVPPFGHGAVEEMSEVPVVDVDVVDVVLELGTCPFPPQVFEFHVAESPFGHGVLKVVPILVKGMEGTAPLAVVVESVDVVSELETLPFPPEVVELHEVSVPELPPGHVLDVQEFPVVESPGHGVVEPVGVVEVDVPDTEAGHGVTLVVSDVVSLVVGNVVDVPTIPVLPDVVVVVLVGVLSEPGHGASPVVVADVPSTPVLPLVVVVSPGYELAHGVVELV
ncbi:hypothetical protein BBJ28_00000398 [Nothophytophthora sp. Chile5]|nr:hypothetical protein BBJ28_00000398 [Nothophytophthora sp. Chile5]